MPSWFGSSRCFKKRHREWGNSHSRLPRDERRENPSTYDDDDFSISVHMNEPSSKLESKGVYLILFFFFFNAQDQISFSSDSCGWSLQPAFGVAMWDKHPPDALRAPLPPHPHNELNIGAPLRMERAFRSYFLLLVIWRRGAQSDVQLDLIDRQFDTLLPERDRSVSAPKLY